MSINKIVASALVGAAAFWIEGVWIEGVWLELACVAFDFVITFDLVDEFNFVSTISCLGSGVVQQINNAATNELIENNEIVFMILFLLKLVYFNI